MKKLALLLAMIPGIAFAQNPNTQNVPITQMQNGNPTQATDAVHVARCNHAGCDYQVQMGGTATDQQIMWNNSGTISGLALGSGLNLTTSGGFTYLNAVGGAGGCPSNGIAEENGPCIIEENGPFIVEE